MSKTKKAKHIEQEPKAEHIDNEIEGQFCCIACQGNAFTRINELPVQKYCGVKDGKAFFHIHRTIVKCDACGQHSILMSHTK